MKPTEQIIRFDGDTVETYEPRQPDWPKGIEGVHRIYKPDPEREKRALRIALGLEPVPAGRRARKDEKVG